MASVMPGLGDPRLMPIDDFLTFASKIRYISVVTSGQPLSDRDLVELES